MSAVEICIYFVVAILGLTYPILLQVVARIDDKYGNDFYSLFLKEPEYKWFKILLYIALILILLYAIIRIFHVLWLNIPFLIMSRIIRFMILISSSLLLFYLTLLIKKVLIYYDPKALVIYMIDRNSEVISNNQFAYFNALFYLLKYSILTQDDKVVRTITDNIYTCFNDFRKNKPDNPEGYPEEYYQFALNTAELLLNLKGNKYNYVEHRAICGPWLLGDFVENKISEKTYSFQWYLLRLAIDAKKDDLVIAFWKHSDQYFQFSLRIPETIYSHSPEFKILNQAEQKSRQLEQERFLQFHYSLGGLLMYQQRYDCIRRSFRYTSSEPPSYYLLPSSVTEVFKIYIFYRDWYERNIPFIAAVYPFPRIEGVKADGIVRTWICKYSVVLFLRQYTLLHYYSYQDFFTVALPETVSEKKYWLENIDYFKTLTSQILEDKEMMKALGFDLYDYISNDWCEKNNKPKPLELIDNLKTKIEDEIKRTEYEQDPDPEKVKQFEESTTTIITQLFSDYQSIFNAKENLDEKQIWNLSGIRYLFEKSAFCKDQGVDHLDADTIGAQTIAANFRNLISETFYFIKSQSFLFKDSDLGTVFNRLKLNGNKHIIVSFGINESRLTNLGFNKNYFNNIEIVPIQACNYELLGESFFILNRADLPYLKFITKKEEVNKYKLKLLNSEISLYGGIINLFREESIRKEFEDSDKDKDLNEYVLAYIALWAEIQWKKNVQMIQIRLDSPYDQRGLTNYLHDIKPFDPPIIKR